MQRERARLRTSAMTRTRMFYDGATTSHRSGGWRPAGTDANQEVRLGGAKLREVSRDMVRNNPYAAKAKTLIAGNVVGRGILPSVEVNSTKGTEQLEELMVRHFDTTAIDATGKTNLYGIQDLVMATVVESGECLVRMRPRRASDNLPLPFQLQVLEPDFLDPLIDGPQKNGNFAVQGIEFDAIGRVVAYHLFNEHPGNVNFFRTLKSTSVPADLIAHVYRVDRPGQVRGVSWFAPVVLRLNDFRDFNDAQLVRQKIAACFAAFISGEVDETQLISDETAPSGMTLEGFEPGMIQRLRNGEQVSFSAPPTLDGHESYSSVTLHEIAAGLGVSYEALTGDLKGVNFSSGRMGWLEFQRNIDSWRDKMLKPQLLDRVGLWFIAACRLGEGVNLSPDARVIWSSPRREMISPKDEIPYKVVEVRAGFKSRSQIIREDGFDPAKVDAEIADDNKRQDKLKLILDTDPRQRTAGGNAVTSGADAANGSTSKSSKSGAGSASPADDQKEPADG